MSYENQNPTPDKLLNSNGSIQSFNNDSISDSTELNIQKFKQSNPIPNKFLYPDGTIKDKDGNTIQESTEENVKKYNQSVPIPAKFLHEDGTIDENIGGQGLEYKLYAWEVSIDHTTIGYTEVEDIEVGDVLLIPENTGVGPITDTNQLKKKGLVTSVSENHITVEIEEGHEIVFERDSENDWSETITDIKGTLDISQSGLIVSEKGKVMKALDILTGGGISKLYCYIDSDEISKIYTFTENPTSGVDIVITTVFASSGTYNPSFDKNYSLGPGGRIVINNKSYKRYSDGDIEL